MMNHNPRKKTDLCAVTDGVTRTYCGGICFNGRKLIQGTEVFRIGDVITSNTYFEGRPDEKGVIQWSRTSSGRPPKTRGNWNPHTGQFLVEFDDEELAKNEEITFSYEWQPHHLSGALVMVRINNEDRLVPILEIQAALYSYLGDD